MKGLPRAQHDMIVAWVMGGPNAIGRHSTRTVDALLEKGYLDREGPTQKALEYVERAIMGGTYEEREAQAHRELFGRNPAVLEGWQHRLLAEPVDGRGFVYVAVGDRVFRVGPALGPGGRPILCVKGVMRRRPRRGGRASIVHFFGEHAVGPERFTAADEEEAMKQWEKRTGVGRESAGTFLSGVLNPVVEELDVSYTPEEIAAAERRRWTVDAAKKAHLVGEHVPERVLARIPPKWYAKHGVTSGFIREELLPVFAGTQEHMNVPGLPIVMVLDDSGKPVRPMVYVGYDPYAPFVAVSLPLEFGRSPHITMVPLGQVKSLQRS